jgi:hypothetical protein
MVLTSVAITSPTLNTGVAWCLYGCAISVASQGVHQEGEGARRNVGRVALLAGMSFIASLAVRGGIDMTGIRSKIVITGVAALVLAGCGSTASSFTPVSQTFVGSPSAAAAAGSPTAAAGSPSAPPDPAVAVCQGFAAIYPYMKSQLLTEADNVVNPVTTDNWKLDGDADKMSHWSYVMTQAVMNGTTSATVQFANDLGDAGTEVAAASFPPTAISTPDPITALVDIDRVQNDCSSLTG